ncbi:MAG: hypothetical protein GY847_13725 [Proteobacteria bacterium]|nr:hypothetical protein [Pseudomonadota bacterium]
MAKLTEELLERYHDGELSPRKAKWVEQRLKESPEHRNSLEKMVRMKQLIHLMNEEALTDVSFAGFKERVEIGIKREQGSGAWERLKVWAAEFFEHRQVIWVPSAAVATVAIAVLIALPFVTGTPAESTYDNANNGIWMASNTPGVEAPGSTIVSINFGGATGEKYDIPDGQGGTVGVVWIVEKP